MKPNPRKIFAFTLLVLVFAGLGSGYAMYQGKQEGNFIPENPDIEQLSTPTPSSAVEISTSLPLDTSTAIPIATQEQPVATKPTTTNIASSSTNFVSMKVNKQTSIGTFVPPELTMIPSGYATRSIQVTSRIIPDLKNMIDAAHAAGVDLKVVSGYRSYGDQQAVFNSYVTTEMNTRNIPRAQAEEIANTYSAKPGHSEHQLGTVVDLLSSESDYSFNVSDDMEFVQWIVQNSTKYNFYVSYPKGNTEYKYEPWHLRWKV